MVSWDEQKASFTQRAIALNSKIDGTKVEDLVSSMNSGIAAFIARGGIKPTGATEDVDYKKAIDAFTKLSDLQKQYNDLNKGISSHL
jgi:hypothetical protein